MKPLYLIDGHNLLYRAFFGLPRLSAPDGRPTHVVVGFARTLLRILAEEPGGLAVVFDSPEPTPRHALFPAYKANRLKQPEDLAVQIPLVKDLVDAMGVARLEIPGVEADDVIGTLARRAERQGQAVVIVSSDKDLYQLVSPLVRIRDGIRDDRLVDEDEVRRTFGVEPSRVVDLLALAGDPSDNVPGLPGVGEKTAARLIRELGSLEAVLSAAPRLKGAVRRVAAEHADLARLSRDLVRIDTDLSLDVPLDALRPRGMDRPRLAALFRALGFRALMESLGLKEPPPPPGAKEAAPATVFWLELGGCEEALRFLDEGVSGSAALALAEDGGGLVAGVAGAHGVAIVPGAAVPALLRELARRPVVLYLFDAKRFLRRAGAGAAAGELRLFDVQVAAHLLAPDEGTPRPEVVQARFLPDRPFRGREPGRAGAAQGAADLYHLGRRLEERLREAGLDRVFGEVDMPLIPVLLAMEDRGIGIDPAVFRALSEELAEKTRRIEERVRELAGTEINVNSPKQLAFLLFEKLGLPPVRRTKTGFSTDVDVLEQLKGLHPIPALVLEYRTLAKLKSTYVDVLPRLVAADGRVHTTFHLTQTATGRLSSSDPNLQNIPVRTETGRRIRSGFVAREGWVFVGADYSQIELRLLAHLSGSVELLRVFAAGEDVHAATACRIFGISPAEVTPEHRRKAKAINFGILYGMSSYGLSRELGIGAAEAKCWIDQYFERYPGVREYLDGVIEGARRNGFVQTIMGRRRYLPDIGSRNRVVREAAERMAVNTPIQGSAADLIKMAMVRAEREFARRGMRGGLVLQVHDELIAEAPEEEGAETARLLREAMEGVAALTVPLAAAVRTGKNWGEIH